MYITPKQWGFGNTKSGFPLNLTGVFKILTGALTKRNAKTIFFGGTFHFHDFKILKTYFMN